MGTPRNPASHQRRCMRCWARQDDGRGWGSLGIYWEYNWGIAPGDRTHQLWISSIVIQVLEYRFGENSRLGTCTCIVLQKVATVPFLAVDWAASLCDTSIMLVGHGPFLKKWYKCPGCGQIYHFPPLYPRFLGVSALPSDDLDGLQYLLPSDSDFAHIYIYIFNYIRILYIYIYMYRDIKHIIDII